MLILASASDARRRLLQQAGISHRIMISGFDEEMIYHPDPKKLVQKIAQAKAETVVKKLFLEDSEEEITNHEFIAVLGCDSVFEFEGQIFGKPRDAAEAKLRWQRMSSSKGVLHTGHALLTTASCHKGIRRALESDVIKECISTVVHFSELTMLEIQTYVDSGEPLNCAGGFALEGHGGLFIDRLEGCYSNVIGLSLPWLRKALLNIRA